MRELTRQSIIQRFRLLLLGVLLAQTVVAAIQYKDHYSPWNKKRAPRGETRYILLHTTEGPGKGSLEKLHRYGEAHYMVDTDGVVYRLIDRRRVAMHAGRSMWEGLTGLDDYAIGIEVVGYHNRDITRAQISALRELLDHLKGLYKIPDQRIIPHSMVAYGSPNRWHRRSHRGRKRCGMQFADRSLREKLGLRQQPLSDPDVKAGRLVNADPYLALVLFGTAREQTKAAARFDGDAAMIIGPGRSAWDIARDQYQSPDTLYRFPDGKELRGNQVKNWKSMPPGTRVVLAAVPRENEEEKILEIGTESGSAGELAGDEALAATTIYFLKDGRVRQGSEMTREQVDALPAGTRILVGYVHGGYITAKRSAFDICGTKWNAPTTFYRFNDGRVLTGEQVTQGGIPPMTMVFFVR
jgi:hypothetical protein